MRFIQELQQVFQEAQSQQIRTALATVVAVEGSSYRRIGARMMVWEDGQFWGGISGGCLEGDALKKARWAIVKDQPSVTVYDTSREDDHQIGVGLGCQGIIHILFQPIDPADSQNPMAVLEHCLETPRKVQALVTITSSSNSLFPLGQTWAWADTDPEIKAALPEPSPNPRSQVYKLDLPEGPVAVCLEYIFPTIRIVMGGFQADTLPLGQLAHQAGFEPWLWTKPQKIASKLSWPVVSEDQLPDLDPFTAVVLMSHDFKTDKNNLKRLLGNQMPKYLGLLGPRVRAERLWRELSEEGIDISADQMSCQYAPAGLDIGATTPDEIALSILAEIRAVFSDRAGQSLRLRPTPIHERVTPLPSVL